MSELKSVYIDRTGDWVRSENDTGKFYLKEEVDHYISKLIADQQLELDDWYCKVQHHKHKRCLAMARWCMTEYLHSKCLDFTNTEQWYWRRWHIRWRNLANKFKEAK